MTLQEFIKEKRSDLNLSQNKFAKSIGITQSYFNNIERGELKNPPSLDILNKISYGLGLTEEENEQLFYLAAYDRTPDIIKEALVKKEKEISFLQNNATIQSDDSLSPSDRIPVFERISAGIGVFSSDQPTEFLAIPGIRNHGNIFAVNVWGDSMEPTIKDGSIIIAKRDTPVVDGEIGAFFIDDEAYVKRLLVTSTHLALISDNPKYPPIFIHPSDNFKIVGKVIKVLSDV